MFRNSKNNYRISLLITNDQIGMGSASPFANIHCLTLGVESSTLFISLLLPPNSDKKQMGGLKHQSSIA